jgi:hypothetical protein
MNDQEYYTKLDGLFDEIMRQASKLVFQNYGTLNEVLMETTKRLQAAHPIETTISSNENPPV